ncbi:MAG: thioesterase [Alphaproteobacteria bacterium]|nr:thioesterase [Alphaproteobacteria bacterium]
MTEKLIESRVLQAYQCDRYGNVRPLILMNELQGVADKHAEQLGFGYSYCIAHGLAWVVTHYLVDVIEMPGTGEEICISTWPSVSDSLRAVRDFEIRGTDNRLMVRATSQWILIDLNTRRPVRLTEHVPDSLNLSERAWERGFDKFPGFEPSKTHVFKCRFDDIDVNQHINNAVYVVWATESVGYEYRNQHRLSGIEINFQKEINPNTPSVEIDVAIDGLVSHHKIRTSESTHAQIKCIWQDLNN